MQWVFGGNRNNSQLPDCRPTGSNPRTGSRKSLRWFPLMPDTFCLFQCSPAKKLIYGLLLRASAETLLQVARNPRHLGAEIGFFSVLHTWNQKTPASSSCPLCHPGRWALPRSHPLDPVPSSLLSPHSSTPTCVSRQVRRRSQVGFSAWPASSFRRSGSARATQDLRCLAPTTVPKRLDRLPQTTLRRSRLRTPVSRPLTHRVAISNHRLVSLADGHVTFRWRDSAHNNEQKLMTVSLDEFLRRFLLHLLPKGFVRVRHFGFLANRRRSTLLPLCFAALGTVPSQIEPATSTTQESDPLWLCPQVRRTDGGHRTTHRCSTPTPFSTTVGHYYRMKRLAHNSKPPHGSPRRVPVRPAPDPIPASQSLSHRFRISIVAPIASRAPSSASVLTPANFNTSPSLHSICIRPASAMPAASF